MLGWSPGGSGRGVVLTANLADFGVRDGTQDFGRQVLEMREGRPWHRSTSRSVSGKGRGGGLEAGWKSSEFCLWRGTKDAGMADWKGWQR